MASGEVTAIQTRWGWISQRGLHRLKEEHEKAVKASQPSFMLDGQPMLTRFAGYMIEFCEMEGLVPVKTEIIVPVFTRE